MAFRGLCRRTIPHFERGEMKRDRTKEYRCEATSVAGFIQQVAVAYLARGYWFYVPGWIPEHKDPRRVDQKLIEKYRIDTPRWDRIRRKAAGLANMQYIRHERFFLLMATLGQHPFFQEEAVNIRDARRIPIKYAGYSLSFRNKRASIRIAADEYSRLKAHFLEISCRRSVEGIASEFARLHFQPYSPIRGQLLSVWRSVNRPRQTAGLEPVPIAAVPWKRKITRPFDDITVRNI